MITGTRRGQPDCRLPETIRPARSAQLGRWNLDGKRSRDAPGELGWALPLVPRSIMVRRNQGLCSSLVLLGEGEAPLSRLVKRDADFTRNRSSADVNVARLAARPDAPHLRPRAASLVSHDDSEPAHGYQRTRGMGPSVDLRAYLVASNPKRHRSVFGRRFSCLRFEHRRWHRMVSEPATLPSHLLHDLGPYRVAIGLAEECGHLYPLHVARADDALQRARRTELGPCE